MRFLACQQGQRSAGSGVARLTESCLCLSTPAKSSVPGVPTPALSNRHVPLVSTGPARLTGVSFC
ncbi:hypothetical protein TIFTF001_020028 [Ficus carica]|uniref:Uncharacterized protein n=1 Tax=Ficus carica TaxID=3494 RepID=A0AA88DDB3_FICCA|nr:hypothetical protein TIFTF001_020028 [Ficus carica]